MQTESNADDSTPDDVSAAEAARDPYAVMRNRSFRRFLAGNFLSVLGFKMQLVAIGFEIYQRTREPLALGLVGLVQILPLLLLAVWTGHLADRFDRKRIILLTLPVQAAASLGLAAVSRSGLGVWLIYALLLVNSIARAFQQPAKASLLPQLVDRKLFSSAVTWNTGAFQLAFMLGPALGGLAIALFAGGSHSFWEIPKLIEGETLATADVTRGTAVVYLFHAAAAMAFFTLLLLARPRPVARANETMTFHSLAAGARFVVKQKVMLAALTLDLFAVLLGGATALLPVYASPAILNVGPVGLGWMEAAPAVGAVLMAIYIAHRAPLRHAGRAMLLSVAGFGVATIIFGLSRSFPLSLVMLFLTGALDNISVVVRHTLVQVLTPDAMRGRVSAINQVFIGASNELGAFESGVVAQLFAIGPNIEDRTRFGTTVSVVLGGIGTLIVVAALWRYAPGLRNYGRLAGEEPPEVA